MAASRRRFPEIDLDAELLIEQLVTERKGDLRSRPYLISVHNWSSISPDQQRLLIKARNDCKAHGSPRSSSARTKTQPSGFRPKSPSQSTRRQPPPPRQMTSRQRYGLQRLSWLRSKVPDYRLAQGWERTAWLEAYDRRHLPRVLRLLLLAGVFAGLTYLTNSWVWGVGGAVVIAIAAAVLQSLLIKRLAQKLLALFAEAQAQSRHLPPALRQAVLERDGYVCRRCSSPSGPLHIDHKIPYSRGGTREMSNLQVLCGPCNMSKGARHGHWRLRRLLAQQR